jgi:hypothetical protein
MNEIIFGVLVLLFFIVIFFMKNTYEEVDNSDIRYIIKHKLLTREIAIENLRSIDPLTLIKDFTNDEDIPSKDGIKEISSKDEIEIKEDLISFLVENDNPEDVDLLLEYESEEEIFKRSLKSGSLEIIKSLTETFNIGDDIESLKTFLKDNYGLNPISSVMRWCCINGKLNVVEWLVDKYKINESIIREDKCMCFSEAVASGNVDLTKFLKNKYNLSRGDAEANNGMAIYNAIFFNHFEMLKWLITEFNLLRKNIIDEDGENFITACGCDNIDIIKFLAENFKITKSEAIKRNYTSLMNYISKHKGKQNFIWFAETFSLDEKDIKFLITKIFCFASIDVIIYISTKYKIKGNDISYDSLQTIIENDRDDVLSFIHNKISSIENFVKKNDCYLYKHARINSSTRCIEFFIKEIGVLK